MPTPLRPFVWASLLVLLAGCPSPDPKSASSPDHSPAASEAERASGASAARETAVRVRTAFDVPLNADAGWAAATNAPATVDVEAPFRLRFEADVPPHMAAAGGFRLQYRRNDGTWTPVPAADFPYPSGATPRVSVVAADAFAHGAATTDLLDESDAPFAGGGGVSLADTTARSAPQAPDAEASGEPRVQLEWEWPVVLRRYADGAVTNETGDRFAFRMVDARGRPFAASTRPVVTASVPPRLLAGTYPETPGRIGPWEASDGALYVLMEPAETYNVLMVVKSTDGGDTWREVDGANRPVTGDLEGFASDLRDDTIHILHQIDAGVLYHAFRTSDHPTAPDTWAVRDDTLAAPGEPPVQVAAVTARTDGSVVGVYGGPETLHYAIRTPDGAWGAPARVDAAPPAPLSGPQVALGRADTVHLAYTRRDGTAWYRQIRPEGTLTPAEPVDDALGTTEADVGSVLPLVHLPATRTTAIVYRRADGTLWTRWRTGDGGLGAPQRVTDRAVVQNAVDSDQTGADAIGVDGSVHVLFVEADTGRLYHTHARTPDAWAPAALTVDGVDVQWVRGQPLARGADAPQVYGFVYDAGSNGGSGLNRYETVELTP